MANGPSPLRLPFGVRIRAVARLALRPYLYDANALADVIAAGHVETNGGVENVVRFVEPVAGINQALDVQIVGGPFLDLEEAASIGIDRIVGLLRTSVLSLVPLDPFIDQPGVTLVFKLSWYGQPRRFPLFGIMVVGSVAAGALAARLICS